MAAEVLLGLLGIILPSIIVTAVIRRWIEPVPWRMAGLFLGLVVAFLGRGALTSLMPVPLDKATRGYPHRAVIGEMDIGNPLTVETALQILPWMQVVRESFAAGEAPLWNRYPYSGYPLVANSQSAPFSPFFLSTLFVPLPKQLVAMAGLKLFMALLFSYLLVKDHGVSPASAVFGSLIFSFSLFQVAFLYFPMTAVTSLLPALLFAVGRIIRNPSMPTGLLLGIVTAAILLSGHPESAIHCALAALAFVVVQWLTPRGEPRWRRVFPSMFASIFWAILVSAPAWAPTAEQVPLTSRVSNVEAGARSDTTHDFPIEGLPLMIDPNWFGHPARGTWSWRFNYAEAATLYLGLTPLVLVAILGMSRASTRRDRLLLLAALVFFLLALDLTPAAEAVNHLPVFGWIANHRLRFVLALIVALVSARAIDRLRDDDLLIGLFASLGLLITLVTLRHLSGNNSGYWAGLAALGGFWLAVAFKRWRPAGAPHVATIASVFLAAELLAAGAAFHTLNDRRMYAPALPIVDALLEHSQDSDPFRIVGVGWTMLPDMSTFYGLEDIRGNDPVVNRGYLSFLDLFTVRPPEGGGARLVSRVPQPALDFLNVRYLFTRPGKRLREPMELVYSGADGNLYENPRALPRVFVPESWIEVDPDEVERRLSQVDDFGKHVLVESEASATEQRNGHVRDMDFAYDGFATYRFQTNAGTRTLIATSIPRPPGWKLAINGRKHDIETINGAFVGFFVPAGESTAVLRYRPWTFNAGLIASGSALLVALVVLWSRRRRVDRGSPRGPNTAGRSFPSFDGETRTEG